MKTEIFLIFFPCIVASHSFILLDNCKSEKCFASVETDFKVMFNFN